MKPIIIFILFNSLILVPVFILAGKDLFDKTCGIFGQHSKKCTCVKITHDKNGIPIPPQPRLICEMCGRICPVCRKGIKE